MNEISQDFLPIFPKDSARWLGIEPLQSACLGCILLDIEAITSVDEHLTPREAEKAMRLGSRRRKDFTAARVALKRLARGLGLVTQDRSDREIETLDADNVRPCIDQTGVYCSVSHSGRLVVAVAHRHPIGVDIEVVSERATRIWSRFLSPIESGIAMRSGLNPERAAGRAWTSKEAAAKAFGLHLFQAIHEVNVLRLGEVEGLIRYQEKDYSVRHAEGNGYIMSLIVRDAV